jgi:ribose/xylose/arabinose/galactoside ABC-type transport system permease subunit
MWSRQAALVIIFCGFAASSFLKWFYYRVIRRGPVFGGVAGTGQTALMSVDDADISENGDEIYKIEK